MANINDIISDNTGLIYQQLHRFKMIDDQDAESLAYEALYKAATTYDADAGSAFSTYATCVIANALRMHYRTCNKKRQLHTLSYNALVSDDDESKTFEGMLTDSNTAEHNLLTSERSERIAAALNKVRSDLVVDSHIRIFDLWCDSDYIMKQSDIARELKVTQPCVSRVLSNIKYRLRVELEDYL